MSVQAGLCCDVCAGKVMLWCLLTTVQAELRYDVWWHHRQGYVVMSVDISADRVMLQRLCRQGYAVMSVDISTGRCVVRYLQAHRHSVFLPSTDDIFVYGENMFMWFIFLLSPLGCFFADSICVACGPNFTQFPFRLRLSFHCAVQADVPRGRPGVRLRAGWRRDQPPGPGWNGGGRDCEERGKFITQAAVNFFIILFTCFCVQVLCFMLKTKNKKTNTQLYSIGNSRTLSAQGMGWHGLLSLVAINANSDIQCPKQKVWRLRLSSLNVEHCSYSVVLWYNWHSAKSVHVYILLIRPALATVATLCWIYCSMSLPCDVCIKQVYVLWVFDLFFKLHEWYSTQL